MIRALIHSTHGQLTLGLSLLCLAGMLWGARRERGESLPLSFWLAPATAMMLLGVLLGVAQQWSWVQQFAGQGSADQFAHALYARGVAEPLRLSSGAAAVLLTAATALSSFRREGWRRLTVLATLVALTAATSSLYDLLFAFHEGLRGCEIWAEGELNDYLRGQNQILVARGALITCGMGATLALAGWALHPSSWPGARDSLGVALCLLLGGLPAAGLDLATTPWLEDTLLARVPAFMGITEKLPDTTRAARGPCHVDEVWAWEDGRWRQLSAPRTPPASLHRLLALPGGAPAEALLSAPPRGDKAGHTYLGLHDPERTLALDTHLGQLSRLRALELVRDPGGLSLEAGMPVEALVAACPSSPCALALP
ncbi:MAG: hypothetical protein H6740_04450 [Alphaproteobacteria bacterium]|nr:hypothetical protein [Alphaproteobacteria bacterium]